MKYLKQLWGLPNTFRVFFIVHIVAISGAYYNFYRSNYTFNGVIEKIRYEEPKHRLYLTINKKEYDLGTVNGIQTILLR